MRDTTKHCEVQRFTIGKCICAQLIPYSKFRLEWINESNRNVWSRFCLLLFAQQIGNSFEAVRSRQLLGQVICREKTLYQNYQRVMLQESPGNVRPNFLTASYPFFGLPPSLPLPAAPFPHLGPGPLPCSGRRIRIHIYDLWWSLYSEILGCTKMRKSRFGGHFLGCIEAVLKKEIQILSNFTVFF